MASPASRPDTAMLRSLRSTFAANLKDFAASSSPFRILRSTSRHPDNASRVKTLFVLDSSFNPPTKAHLKLATSALKSVRSETGDGATDAHSHRLLLLLATQNADKAPKPAAFEERLVMMYLLGEQVRADLKASSSSSSSHVGKGDVPHVDIGVTKEPFFHRKAVVVDESGVYGDATQVYLVGFDSLLRIFDRKYYDAEKGFEVLEPFLGRHGLRATYRTDDQWGSKGEQEDFVRKIALGKREGEGIERRWGERIELVEGREEGEEVVSSTEARRCLKEGNREGFGRMTVPMVEEWVWTEGFYRDEDRVRPDGHVE